MIRWTYRISWLLAGLLMAGCNFFGTAPAEGGGANNETLSAQITAIGATATIESERMMVTIEAAETAMRRAEQESTRIASTLMALGTPDVSVVEITPIVPTPQINPPGGSGPAFPTRAIVPTSAGARANITLAPPTPELVQLETAEPTPPAANAGAASSILSNLTMSPAVGADDCPVNARNAFTSADESIYISALARGLNTNNQVSTRWYREGTEVISYDWSPDSFIQEACIWFFISPQDVAFTPGNWRVELYIDGGLVGQALTFTISE
ncbi:MAG: hypothetical protein GYB67_11900 [Chloroflexi bacterium]|nr:hypothetical protein [Chloroflexota bacterium]